MNWGFDTNYMYTGPHNQTVVAFMPESLMVWPLNYVSYVVVALALLSLIFAILWIAQGRRDAEPSLAIPGYRAEGESVA